MKKFSLFLIPLLLLLSACKEPKTTEQKPLKLAIQKNSNSYGSIHSLAEYNYAFFMEDPYRILNYWGDETLPIEHYSSDEYEFQQELNKREQNEFIVTENQHIKFKDNNYQLPIEKRNIDNEPITPYTWKWARFEITHKNTAKDFLKLCRPNWWFRKHKVTNVGDTTFLAMPEAGIVGDAVLTKLIPCQLDTRLITFGEEKNISRPVTGTFHHYQAVVWDFKFSNGETVGATTNHPFFSLDRNEYVKVGELRIGERIKTLKAKEVTLVGKEKRPEAEPVYNLEIYRDHNFFVGEEGFLVHNSCILEALSKNKKFGDKFDKLSDSKRLKFLEDFKDIDADLVKKFDDSPELIDNWSKLDDANVSQSISKNTEAITGPEATLEAIQISEKAKPTWSEIQALFKRGNDFNAKARIKYKGRYSEIVLKGVNGKAGKRLDTYLPPTKGKRGQIISRKATTLSEIQPNTFKSYLNELITKYPKGAELNSSKFPSGTKLEGDYFLEIPTSNKSFFESSTDFQKVLTDFNKNKKVNIQIKYLDE